MKKFISLIACVCLICAGTHAQRTLKGKLYFKQNITDNAQRAVKGKSTLNYPAANVKVVLIDRNDPFLARTTTAQKKVFETLENRQFNCSSSLNSLKHTWTITNTEGYYFFKDVPAGQYVIKVCETDGNFYRFKISTNNYRYQMIPDLAAKQ